MTKIATLKQNGDLVVRSPPKPPAAKAKRSYFEFDEYVRVAEALRLRADAIFERKRGDMPLRLDDLDWLFAEFDRYRQHYESDELYRERKTARRDLLGLPKSGGRMLNGREWNEMPVTTRPTMQMLNL